MLETKDSNHNPLNDEIELLDLPPTIFFAIKRHKRDLTTIGELTELDFSNIKGLGSLKLEVLNRAIIDYLKKHF